MMIGGKFCQKGTYSKIYLDVVDFGPEKVDFELGMVYLGAVLEKVVCALTRQCCALTGFSLSDITFTVRFLHNLVQEEFKPSLKFKNLEKPYFTLSYLYLFH